MKTLRPILEILFLVLLVLLAVGRGMRVRAIDPTILDVNDIEGDMITLEQEVIQQQTMSEVILDDVKK